MLSNVEALKERKLAALREALGLYRGALGLAFEQPEEDDSSGAGDYDLADVLQFPGHATVSNRQTISVPTGRQFAGATGTTRARYVAISSANNMDVLVMQLGSDQ